MISSTVGSSSAASEVPASSSSGSSGSTVTALLMTPKSSITFVPSDSATATGISNSSDILDCNDIVYAFPASAPESDITSSVASNVTVASVPDVFRVIVDTRTLSVSGFASTSSYDCDTINPSGTVHP